MTGKYHNKHSVKILYVPKHEAIFFCQQKDLKKVPNDGLGLSDNIYSQFTKVEIINTCSKKNKKWQGAAYNLPGFKMSLGRIMQ